MRGVVKKSGSDEQLDELHNCEATKQRKTRNVSKLARNTKDGQADDITCADMIMALWMRNANKRPRQSTCNEGGHPS